MPPLILVRDEPQAKKKEIRQDAYLAFSSFPNAKEERRIASADQQERKHKNGNSKRRIKN